MSGVYGPPCPACGALPVGWVNDPFAAQGLDAATIERFREAIVTIIGRCEAIEDEAAEELAMDQTEHAAGFYRGQKSTAKSLRNHLADLARPFALNTASTTIRGEDARLREALEWKQAVIDGLVCSHIYTAEHESNPKKALNDLICWEVDARAALQGDAAHTSQEKGNG